jgi:hypothetical protein
MKHRTVFTWAILCLLTVVVFAAPAMAQETATEPVVIIVSQSLDAWEADAKLTAEVLEKPELGLMIGFASTFFVEGGPLGGIDTTRPFGAAICLKDGEPVGYGAIPVDNIDQLELGMSLFLDSIEEVDGYKGVYRIEAKNGGNEAFVLEVEDWILISDSPDAFPAEMPTIDEGLAQLAENAMIGIKLYPQRVPAELREEFYEKLTEEIIEHHADEVEGKLDALQQCPYADQLTAFHDNIAQQLSVIGRTVFDDLESVTAGIVLDEEAGSVKLCVKMTAVNDSDLADFLADDAAVATQFSAFRSPMATLFATTTGINPLGQMVDWSIIGEVYQDAIYAGIDEHLEDASKNADAKAFMDEVLCQLGDTIESGRRDGAVAVGLHPKGVVLITGGYVADGYALEELAGQFIDAMEAEGHECPCESTLETDVAQIEGVNIHKLSFEIPEGCDNRDKVVELIGETAEIAVGFGPEAVYVAAGRMPVEILTHVIQESVDAENDPVRCQASLSLLSLAKFVAVHGDTERERTDSAAAVELLEQYEDSSDVSVTIEAIPDGRRLVVELEEGVIRILAAIAEEKANN